MTKKLYLILILIVLLLVFFFFLPAQGQRRIERGVFSIYFMEEKVGYEEYTWEEDASGYLLTVRGRMTKPASIEIDELKIRVDKNFVAQSFYFKGSVSEMEQEAFSTISEGDVENRIKVGDHESQTTLKIRRDAFLLPNPVFSPYMIITRKYRCLLSEKVTLSAYIIPQLEVSFTLEPKEVPCTLQVDISGIKVELQTDEGGELKALFIPAQNLEVIRTGF